MIAAIIGMIWRKLCRKVVADVCLNAGPVGVGTRLLFRAALLECRCGDFRITDGVNIVVVRIVVGVIVVGIVVGVVGVGRWDSRRSLWVMTRSIHCLVNTGLDCCCRSRFVVDDLPNELVDDTVACSELLDEVVVDFLL